MRKVSRDLSIQILPVKNKYYDRKKKNGIKNSIHEITGQISQGKIILVNHKIFQIQFIKSWQDEVIDVENFNYEWIVPQEIYLLSFLDHVTQEQKNERKKYRKNVVGHEGEKHYDQKKHD